MLTRNLFRRPRIKLEDTGDTQAQRPEIPEELYTACPVCKAMSAADELRKNASVCPKCGHHFRISARRRVELFCDEGTFAEMWTTLHGENPIGFPDYEKKLAHAREQSGEVEAVVTGECRIGGERACVFFMEPSFMMASMGTAVGEKITLLFEHAREKGLPVVGFCASGGARMQEGILSLMQMAKTTGADQAPFGRGQPLHRRAHRSHHRRRGRQLRHGGRHHHRRAERPHRLCRPARHRADHPPETGPRLPALGISAGKGLCGYDL